MDQQQFNGNYITATGMDAIDPVQSTRLVNCSLIAAISSCAWTGKGPWYKNVGANSEVVASSYNLQFYDYNKQVPPVKTSSKLPQDPVGNLIYAKSSTASECWPGIIEKGYYMSRDRILRNIDNDNPDLEYYNDQQVNPTNDPSSVLYHLLAAEPQKRSKLLNGTDYKEGMIWSDLKQICTLGRVPNLKIKHPAVAYTFDKVQDDWKTNTISPKHTYSILGLAGTVDTANPPNWTSKYVVLRDPRGANAEPTLPAPDMLTAGSWINGINFATRDGIFALRSDLFPVYFQGYSYSVC
jgi:hypothetical protein